MPISVVILAAGQGTRMRSDLPKVLHPLAGRPMVEHVIASAAGLSSEPPVLVYGHGAEQIKTALASANVRWAEQAEQLGTGHAVMQALPQLNPSNNVLVLYADVPLLTAETLEGLTGAAADNAVTLLTVKLDDPTGYGRIVRDTAGNVVRIVEQKDASPEQLAIEEINTGIMVVRGDLLHEWLPALSSDNAQGEYYLTDVVAMAVERGLPVQACIAADEAEVAGVNDRAQLARLERHYQHRLAEHWMRQGVSFADPGRVDFRGDVRFGRDVFVDVNVVFSGRVVVGDGVRIASNCVIEDSRIGDHTEILPNCVIDAAEIGGQARIGPFARVRPETVLGSGVHVGNFVEIKKSVVDDGSKINHLSYIGDAEIGARVNVGAGTITCNYDGANKYQTAIEDDVFVGSDTQLVAPVRIGRGATIGAGTTVTRDVGAEKLVVSRVSQREIDGWTRPRKRPPDSS